MQTVSQLNWNDLGPKGENLAELRSIVEGGWSGVLQWHLPPPEKLQVTGIADGETLFKINVQTIGNPLLLQGKCDSTFSITIQIVVDSQDGALTGTTQMQIAPKLGSTNLFGFKFFNSGEQGGTLRVLPRPHGTLAQIGYAIEYYSNRELVFSVGVRADTVNETGKILSQFEIGMTNSLIRQTDSVLTL